VSMSSTPNFFRVFRSILFTPVAVINPGLLGSVWSQSESSTPIGW
jgi:hypothetical protein